MFPSPDSDPCTIFFSDFRDTDHGELPHRWEVRRGETTYAVLLIQDFTLPDAEGGA